MLGVCLIINHSRPDAIRPIMFYQYNSSKSEPCYNEMLYYIPEEMMLTVNGQPLEWFPGITFSDIFKALGYTISNPRVIVRVDSAAVPKAERAGFEIKDGSVVEVLNTLCGG